jgi:hypothetical protein
MRSVSFGVEVIDLEAMSWFSSLWEVFIITKRISFHCHENLYCGLSGYEAV